MFAQHNVTVQVDDDVNTELVFPVSLVEQAETFDALMGDIALAIEKREDPSSALDDHHITDPSERQTLHGGQGQQGFQVPLHALADGL